MAVRWRPPFRQDPFLKSIHSSVVFFFFFRQVNARKTRQGKCHGKTQENSIYRCYKDGAMGVRGSRRANLRGVARPPQVRSLPFSDDRVRIQIALATSALGKDTFSAREAVAETVHCYPKQLTERRENTKLRRLAEHSREPYTTLRDGPSELLRFLVLCEVERLEQFITTATISEAEQLSRFVRTMTLDVLHQNSFSGLDSYLPGVLQPRVRVVLWT